MLELKTKVAEHAEQVRRSGYTVIEAVLTAEQVRQARGALDKILDYEGKHGDRSLWDNPSHQVSHMLIAKDAIFRQLCQTPILLELARSIVGPACTIGSVNGYTTKPNGIAQDLHPDRLLPTGSVGALTMLLTLDQFTRENGCTRVVPYSHDRDVPEGVDKRWECPKLEAQAIDLEVSAGSLIAFNALLVHSSGANRTNLRRRSMHISFLRDGIQPEWDFPLSLTKKFKAGLTKEERQLFGLEARPFQYDYRSCCNTALIKEPRSLRHYLRQLKNKLLAR